MKWNEDIIEVVFSARNNTNTLQLQDDSVDGINLVDSDLTGATKVEVVIDTLPLSFDSTDHPSMVSFANDGKVVLALGSAGIPRGSYAAYFVVYDLANLKGIRWLPDFKLVVK